ncbi:hypothetical protein M3Y96_00883500 [Aphelenchoides besseyi]|nr:hypothetical protein M3Y96_00883500 [Aphelenchoides besseyi]
MSTFMSDTKNVANDPHFFYLRFVLKTITVLKSTVPEDIRLISIGVRATKSVVYDRSVHSIQWFDKKATLNLGKNMVIDVRSSDLTFKLETANNKYTRVIDLNAFQTRKPYSQNIILRSNSNSDSPEYDLEYVLLKDALYIQPNVSPNPSTVESETTAQRRDCGTQISPLTHVDASTLTLDPLPSIDHQKQVLIRLIPLLVNRIYLRLCQQEQLKHIDSKDVQSKQPTKRLCKELKKEQPNTAKIVRSRQMNISRELKKMMVDEAIQFEDIKTHEPSTSNAERNETKLKQPVSQQVQQPTKEPKTTITRVSPTVQPSSQIPPKLLNNLPKQPDLIVEEVSEESDDELSDESENESVDESDEATEKSGLAVELTSGNDEQSSGSAIESSVHEEIHESISSSVPSELASAVESSRASYLESVASSTS